MEKFSEKLKNLFSKDASLQRIPLYFFLTCVLLVVLICKLGETNHYLKEIAKNGTEVIQVETKDNNYDDVADVFIETTESPEDIVPILGELTTDKTTENPTETTTKKNEHTTKESTTKSDNQEKTEDKNYKKTYVLNISSKKIHLPECSFVNRTKEENKKTVELTEQELQEYLDGGYTFCKTCGGK